MNVQGLNGFKTVIYDCDGVMFDSIEANYAFYSIVLNHFGKPCPDRSNTETMRLLHTYSSRDVLAKLFADDPREAEALSFASTIDYRQLIPFLRMEEGLVETLEALKGRVDIAVCTNRSTSVETLLEDFGLTSYFSCVMTAAKVKNPKPHPEPLNKILEHYGIGPSEALFVGDSDLDRQASESAGVPFVAYKSDLSCLARIRRHVEVLDILESDREKL